MGGRGSSSATASMVASSKPKQAGHLSSDETPKNAAETAAYLGVDEGTAKELYSAVKDFTGVYYTDIRKVQRGESDNETAALMGQRLEQYIAAAPKWDGGTTYRGMSLTQEDAAKLLNNWNKGAIIDINGGGTASWSTSPDVSDSFAKGGGNKSVSIVFSCKTQSNGTSIRHISNYFSEQEVLVSKSSRYWVVGTPKKKGGITYIEVEEA